MQSTRRLTAVLFLTLSVLAAAADDASATAADNEDEAVTVRVHSPFAGPAILPDGTSGFRCILDPSPMDASPLHPVP
jgi:hypothetical protein